MVLLVHLAPTFWSKLGPFRVANSYQVNEKLSVSVF